MCQTHLYMLQHPQGYIYNPPKPSFDKEGFRGHELNLSHLQKTSVT